jgi:toxin ParE1/3/4
MTPVWSPEAIDDLAALRAYIEQDNPAAAQRVVGRIIENVEALLPDNPDMGRPGRVPGTRELVIPRTPFVVPYRVVGTTLQILRVYHGARRWPKAF